MSAPPDLSVVLVTLMKGVAYREENGALWERMLRLQSAVRDHVQAIGLELILDEAEGYAYLRQRVVAPEDESQAELPRLVARRPLGFQVSLLLVLLRRRLAEFDAQSGDTRLVLTHDDIVELLRAFVPASGNEARVMDKLEQQIAKVVELGFLRRLRGQQQQYEVARILKAFVDAQWLDVFEEKLRVYREHLESEERDARGT